MCRCIISGNAQLKRRLAESMKTRKPSKEQSGLYFTLDTLWKKQRCDLSVKSVMNGDGSEASRSIDGRIWLKEEQSDWQLAPERVESNHELRKFCWAFAELP